MPDRARNPKKIFISYRREDSLPITERIHDYLEQEFSGEVFMDTSTGGRSNDWRKELRFQIEGCAVMLVVIGKGWLGSSDKSGRQRLFKRNDPVRDEIRVALRRNVPLIVVLVNGAQMPEEGLPQSIAKLVRHPRVEVGNNPRFKSDTEWLIKMIEERLPGSPSRTFHHLRVKSSPVMELIGWAATVLALISLPVLLISSFLPASRDDIIKYFKEKPPTQVPHSNSTRSP